MGWYITRQPDGSISRFANKQFEGQEFVEDNHIDIRADNLKEAKLEKLQRLREILETRLQNGFLYQTVRYQLDEASQNRITAIALKAERVVAGRPNATWAADFVFITANNTEVPFTAVEFGAFADAASNVVIARRINARSLKNQILAATNLAQLASVDLTTGW